MKLDVQLPRLFRVAEPLPVRFGRQRCLVCRNERERLADDIANRTGLGRALIGALLLAGATSLPEITATLTAVRIGNLPIAVNNLLGSVVFNTLALAIADATSAKAALTHRSPSYVLVMTGAGVVLLLALMLMAGAMTRGNEQVAPGGSSPEPFVGDSDHPRLSGLLTPRIAASNIRVGSRRQLSSRKRAPAAVGRERQTQRDEHRRCRWRSVMYTLE